MPRRWACAAAKKVLANVSSLLRSLHTRDMKKNKFPVEQRVHHPAGGYLQESYGPGNTVSG